MEIVGFQIAALCVSHKCATFFRSGCDWLYFVMIFLVFLFFFFNTFLFLFVLGFLTVF